MWLVIAALNVCQSRFRNVSAYHWLQVHIRRKRTLGVLLHFYYKHHARLKIMVLDDSSNSQQSSDT